MARKVYYGINNKSKRITKAYAEKNQRAVAVKKIYVGVNGKAKQVFPGMYRWNKYSTKTVYVYKKYTVSSKTEYERKSETMNYYLAQYRFMSGQCAYEEDITELPDRGVFVVNDYHSIPNSDGTRIFFTDYDIRETALEYDRLGKTYCSIGEATRIYTTTLASSGGRALSRWSFKAVSVSARGDYIQDIQSDYDQYPSDGQSGGYWYVFSHTSLVRGNKIGTIDSANENAYPKNGVSGSYYYEFIGSV